MLTLLILLIICVLGTGFFSGSETGFVSWNPLKVSHAAAQGGLSARLGMRLIKGRGRLLATVLIGNNVCNVGAALLFASLFERIDAAVSLDLSKIPSPESWFLTPVVLIFGEVIPKFLYRKYAFPMTLKSVPALAFFFYLASPVFWVLGAFSKIFGIAVAPRDADVREEILLVAVEGVRRGNIFECADLVMKNTLSMKGSDVGSLAVGIGEWKTRHTVYRRSQLLSEFCGDGGLCADEVVVFEDDFSAPAGYVSLLDASEARRGAPLATFGSLMKPMPRLRVGMEALLCLRRMPQSSPRYHLVFSEKGATAILDKKVLFEAAFARG
ncbi:MAG: DUF21 domain-containing protein [Chitinispirillales bacterium]|jgi:CBS domain containing-hemolysin-like protein|nr:DUF21 domain-containing protein [Chitinispirillales bacterium]